jgi:hypothetical protein
MKRLLCDQSYSPNSLHAKQALSARASVIYLDYVSRAGPTYNRSTDGGTHNSSTSPPDLHRSYLGGTNQSRTQQMRVPQKSGTQQEQDPHHGRAPHYWGPLKCGTHVGSHNSVGPFFFNLEVGSTIRGPVPTQNWTHDMTTSERDPLLIQLSFG